MAEYGERSRGSIDRRAAFFLLRFMHFDRAPDGAWRREASL
jgi:hypothetical protein